jgi:hypothetical protein
MSLLTAPMATDSESLLLTELGELAALCRRFAASDCSDTETFRTIVRRCERLCDGSGYDHSIPPACAALSELVYLVLVAFRTRSTEFNRTSVRAIAGVLGSVRSIWFTQEAVEHLRGQLREAGINLRPF